MIRKIIRKFCRSDNYNPAQNAINDRICSELDKLKLLAAKGTLLRMRELASLSNLKDAEFKVFSQFGEDGIIQYLIRQVGIDKNEEIFIEFGVENYLESNTRFLLLNDNWKGLVIDQSESNIKSIQKSEISWRHDLKSLSAFVTRDNIDNLILTAGLKGKIGLLSIDIDGNDYWVWERIKSVDPIIVIIEYNSLYGADRSVVVPYLSDFNREKAHYSWLYWGASIAALTRLAASKGYALVGSNSAGCNLFFVNKSRLGNLKEVSPKDCFIRSRSRDSRYESGELSFLGDAEQEIAVRECLVYDLDLSREIKLKEIF